jgi:alpha/beta superfamily hydrolase
LRDARGVLDGDSDTDCVVVACPPHPQMGGSRSDQRLQTISDALGERGVPCLRFDYGSWDEGRGECIDAQRALEWAHDRFDAVGLFGYSFGAAVALLTAAEADPQPVAVSVLAPPARLDDGTETPPAVGGIEGALEVAFGERDDTVDWQPVVERAREQGGAIEGLPADHHFVGQGKRVGEIVADFFTNGL